MVYRSRGVLRMRNSLAKIGLALICLAPATSPAEGDLISLMSLLQTFTHKLQLALDHRNGELAGFYLHEIEETLEAVEEIAEYDGFPVGQLAGAMLGPAVSRLEAALEGDGPADATREVDALISACNACHTATEHGFIVIRRTDVNPYAQSFEPR